MAKHTNHKIMDKGISAITDRIQNRGLMHIIATEDTNTMTRMVGNWTEEQCQKHVNDFKAAYPDKWNAIIAKAKNNESWDIEEWYDFCRTLHFKYEGSSFNDITNLLFDVNRIIVKEAGL